MTRAAIIECIRRVLWKFQSREGGVIGKWTRGGVSHRYGFGLAFFMATLPAFLMLPASAGAATCSIATEELRTALENRDVDTARKSYKAVFDAQDCSDGFRMKAGLAVSNLHVHVAQEQIKAGQTTLVAQRDFLEQALNYGRTWPVLAKLGDIAVEDEDRDAATRYYHEALAAMDDHTLTPEQPPEATIERIVRLTEANNMLTSQHRSAPRTRSGDFGGLAATGIRGYTIKKVALPITFDFDSARITERGKKAAAEMALFLKKQNPPRITIAGHTDAEGPDDYNLALSRKRAEAVKRYLVDSGFTGAIELRAMGESKPYPREILEHLTDEELWQLDRRVELIR